MAEALTNRKIQTKRTRGHGHVIPQTTRQRMPGTIQNILAARKFKLRRLLDKTPPVKASSAHQKSTSDAMYSIGNTMDEKKCNSSIKVKAQKQSTCEGVMIWAVNGYTWVDRLTARL